MTKDRISQQSLDEIIPLTNKLYKAVAEGIYENSEDEASGFAMEQIFLAGIFNTALRRYEEILPPEEFLEMTRDLATFIEKRITERNANAN